MLILVVVFYHSYRKITTTEIDTRIVGHCCDRHDHVVVCRNVENYGPLDWKSG